MSAPRTTIDCAGVTASIQDYLEDRLAPADRASILRHIASCLSCYEKVVAGDPIQLFAPLADESPAAGRPGFYDGFWAGILEEIDSGTSWGRNWLRAAAAVLVIAGAAASLTLIPERPGVDAPELPSVVAEAEPLPPTVERVVSPDSGDVQIYSMTYYEEPSAGEGTAEATELILIVDSGLDL